MANTAPIPYQFLAIDIPAGETRNIPGQFTWVEILQEFRTASPDVNSQAVTIGFYPGQPQQILPPAITVVLPVGFPSTQAQLVNTDQVHGITVWLITGNGQIPAVDHRLVLPVGSLLNVVVTNTNADPVPVNVISPDPLPSLITNNGLNPAGVFVWNDAANPVPVSPGPSPIGTSRMAASAATTFVTALANINGVIVKAGTAITCQNASGVLTAGGSGAVPILGGINSAGSAPTSYVLPNDMLVPAGTSIEFTPAGGGSASIIGSYTLL